MKLKIELRDVINSLCFEIRMNGYNGLDLISDNNKHPHAKQNSVDIHITK